jgi:hypothetical protein
MQNLDPIFDSNSDNNHTYLTLQINIPQMKYVDLNPKEIVIYIILIN